MVFGVLCVLWLVLLLFIPRCAFIMNNLAWPSIPFEVWLYGLPCYDKNFKCRGTYPRRIALAYWMSFARPSDMCAHCIGCDTPLFLISHPFGDILPDEDKTLKKG